MLDFIADLIMIQKLYDYILVIFHNMYTDIHSLKRKRILH